MISFLRILFIGIIAAMLGVTIRASLDRPLWQIPPEVTGDKWFQATLADAYFGFVTFFVWVAYKERSVVSRIVWFVAIILLGNIAMAFYALLQLFRVPVNAPLKDVLLRRGDS